MCDYVTVTTMTDTDIENYSVGRGLQFAMTRDLKTHSVTHTGVDNGEFDWDALHEILLKKIEMHPYKLNTINLAFSKEHITKFGDTNVFPTPEIYHALFAAWDQPIESNSLPKDTASHWLEDMDLNEWVLEQRNAERIFCSNQQFWFHKMYPNESNRHHSFYCLATQDGKLY